MPPPVTPRSPSQGTPLWDSEAIPAATVMVLRDSVDGVEVLLLRRDRELSFAGGMWVFPGGRIDVEDHVRPRAADPTAHDSTAPAAIDDAALEVAARRAAVREAAEEAGLALPPGELRRWSHWTPPPQSPKRFSTAFFVASLPHDAPEVAIDHGEIRDHRWAAPSAVLELRDAGEVGLTPPTFITLRQLLPHRDVAAVLTHADSLATIEHFATRISVRDDEILALYHGDAGYGSGDADATGPRHRLVMGARWHYERTT